MNKKELVDVVAEKTGFTKKDVSIVTDSLFDTIKESLSTGDKVAVSGFGTYMVKLRKARMARNPQTGEPIEVPEKNAPVFKPSKALKEMV
jgi:DNA-binding protein HU-beta